MKLSPQLQALSDTESTAHARLQQHSTINPILGIRQQMRQRGIPADVLTIDELQSGKRIVLILHDQQPDTVMGQFTEIDATQDAAYTHHPLNEVTEDTLYQWMHNHLRS